MKTVYMLIFFLVIPLFSFSQKKEKVVYKYKKYQKFDFNDLVIDGSAVDSPDDISFTSRYQEKFKNKLPYRKNFNPEIVKTVERIR